MFGTTDIDRVTHTTLLTQSFVFVFAKQVPKCVPETYWYTSRAKHLYVHLLQAFLQQIKYNKPCLLQKGLVYVLCY